MTAGSLTDEDKFEDSSNRSYAENLEGRVFADAQRHA